MAISIHGNTIIVPEADSGVAMAAGMYGRIIGVKVKTVGAAGRAIVYSGTAVDAAKVISDTGDVSVNSFDGLAGIDQEFKNGLYVAVTGTGAVAYVYLR